MEVHFIIAVFAILQIIHNEFVGRFGSIRALLADSAGALGRTWPGSLCCCWNEVARWHIFSICVSLENLDESATFSQMAPQLCTMPAADHLGGLTQTLPCRCIILIISVAFAFALASGLSSGLRVDLKLPGRFLGQLAG